MRKAKIALSHGQCVDVGVLVLAKLVSVHEKWLLKMVMTFFWSSTQAGLPICQAETPLKISRYATVYRSSIIAQYNCLPNKEYDIYSA